MRSAAAVLILLVAVTAGAQVPPPAWETGTYVYDGAGNIRSMGADQFRYDAMGRLVSATYGPGQSQAIEYDRYGNLTTMTTNGQAKTFGVDAATNRVSQNAASVFATYDAAGRITSTLLNADRFEYDALDAVTRSTVDGVTKVHLYTAAGERLASITLANGAETHSDWTLRDASGKVLRRLERNAGTWAWKEDYVYGAGQLLAAENAAGETSHFFPDHLGTPRLITDRRGAQAAIHKYWPFGDEFTDPNQDSHKSKFTGHERDAATLDYMHARYYAPKWGRFLSVDPTWESADLGKPQTWNRYSYVTNNPINLIDPDGRAGTTPGASYSIDPEYLGPAIAGAIIKFGVDVGLPDGSGMEGSSADLPKDPAERAAYLQQHSERIGRASSVQANKKAGDAFRDQVADGLKAEGREVKTEVVKKTPFGPRRIDIEVSQDGKVVGGVETKVGNSRYTPSQRAKDSWLRKVKNYAVVVVRKVL